MRHLCFIDACEIDARVISIHFGKELVKGIVEKDQSIFREVVILFILAPFLLIIYWFVVVEIQENICLETIDIDMHFCLVIAWHENSEKTRESVHSSVWWAHTV